MWTPWIGRANSHITIVLYTQGNLPGSPFHSLWLDVDSLQPSAYLADASVHESSFQEHFPLPELSAALQISSFEPPVFPSELKHLRKVKRGFTERLSNSGNRKHFKKEQRTYLFFQNFMAS
jgi:hypothetical protein